MSNDDRKAKQLLVADTIIVPQNTMDAIFALIAQSDVRDFHEPFNRVYKTWILSRPIIINLPNQPISRDPFIHSL